MLSLIRSLKKTSRKENGKIWRSVVKPLSRSRKKRVTINVSQLNRNTKTKEIVVVPGKVLGSGNIDHPITVAAFSFSRLSRQKILDANGKCLSILELLEKKKTENIKIVM